MTFKLPPYLLWRDGRPRWSPGPRLRPQFKSRDLKDAHGRWLGLEAAIAAAEAANADVAAWRAGGQPRRRPKPPKVTRSGRALWDDYAATPEFRLKAPATQADYAGKARIFLDAFGDAPVAAIGRAALKGWWRELFDTRGHHQANGVLAVTRLLLTHACDLEWLPVNPALALGLPVPPPRVAFWAPAKVAAFVAVADDLGPRFTPVGDAVVVALHSGQRQGDVLALPPRLFTDQRLCLSQFKTGALVDAPTTEPLRARVAQIRARWTAAGIVTRATLIADADSGAQLTADDFRKRFAVVRAEAVARHPELAEAGRMQPALADLRFQDLRDTAVTRLAMAGCTLPMIASITGHSHEHVTSVIKHYLALDAALADRAIELLSAWLQREGIAI